MNTESAGPAAHPAPADQLRLNAGDCNGHQLPDAALTQGARSDHETAANGRNPRKVRMPDSHRQPERRFADHRNGNHKTASDRVQTLSDSDQTASDADQAAAEREQAAFQRSDEDARLMLEETTTDREDATQERAAAGFERSADAVRRDEYAALRDLTAEIRDRAAEDRDRAIERYELTQNSHPGAAAASTRAEAAADRARAAEDRVSAADDRRQGAGERERLESELERAQLDDLTGFYLRGLGKAMLQREIDRCRRSDGRLVLAYMDVDGLKRVNDEQGHDAGDRLLVNVADAIRSRLRSYDPVVRMGGDEFVCVVSEMDLEVGRGVVKAIREGLAERHAGASITVGLATLEADDSLDTLCARADAVLRETKAA